MECNLVWNHTGDFKIRWARIMSSIWNNKYDFRPQFIALHSIQLPLYYSHFEITKFSQYKYFIDQVASLLKSGNKKAFHLILYPNQKWCDIVIEQKWCNLKQKWCNFGQKWCALEQMWFRGKNSDMWINHIVESQSDCRDHQWLQSGYNKGSHLGICSNFTVYCLELSFPSGCLNAWSCFKLFLIPTLLSLWMFFGKYLWYSPQRFLVWWCLVVATHTVVMVSFYTPLQLHQFVWVSVSHTSFGDGFNGNNKQCKTLTQGLPCETLAIALSS